MCFVSAALLLYTKEIPFEAFDLSLALGIFQVQALSRSVVADERLESCMHVILLPSTVSDGVAFMS